MKPAVKLVVEIDLSDRLSVKERKAYTSREQRLCGTFGRSARRATAALNETGAISAPLVVRNDFCYLKEPLDESLVSDRQAPDRSLRPSATRISNSRGVALRLYLAALAVAQARTRLGARAYLDLTVTGTESKHGWRDLIATSAETHRSGRGAVSYQDKKADSVRTALRTLQKAKLVELPSSADTHRPFAGAITLLHEAGQQRKGDPQPYRVPRRTDIDRFLLPEEFITKGWIHVLEDSEITLLLMVRCGLGRLMPSLDETDIQPGEVAIPGGVRLCCYGIHRDPYSTALRSLQRFGLLAVREVNRHVDGRAVDAELQLHRLRVLVEGFDRPAVPHVLQVIREQLRR